MKKVLFILVVIALITQSCGSSRNSFSGRSSYPSAAAVPEDQQDGLSYQTAIFIKETTSMKGIAAEYEWIKKRYTDYTVKKQSLQMQNGRAYDILTIGFPDKKTLDLYFDISNFFGKF